MKDKLLNCIKQKNSNYVPIWFMRQAGRYLPEFRDIRKKNTDFIILNYANEKGAGFDSTTNRVKIFCNNGASTNLKKDRKDRIAKKIIDNASDAGFDAVKFQKRTIEKVYSKVKPLSHAKDILKDF